MKKMFSLVLALVMALSLTTVAWGAASTLPAPDATTGEITLTENVELTSYVPISTHTVINMNGFSITNIKVGANCVFYVTNGASLTINGTGVETISVSNDAGAYAIWSVGNSITANKIVLNNVTVKATTWGVYHNGNDYGADVTINKSTVEGGDVGVFLSGSAAWATASTMNKLTITNGSTVKGGSAVEVKYGDVTVDNSTLTATGSSATMSDNGNGSCSSGYALVLTNNPSEETAGEVAINSGTFVGAVGIKDEATATAAEITVSGGTFSVLPDESYLADGLDLVQDTNGNYVPAVVPAMGDKFDLYLANVGMQAALKAKTPDVAGLSFTEVAAKTNKDGSGRVAYIAANNGQYFVKTTNPTVADYAVTAAGKNTVLYYVTVAGTSAANFEYSEVVKAFDNWGKKCGQYDNTAFTATQKADDYFMAANYKVYRAADAGVGTNYLLDGVVVSGVELGYTIDHNFVANNFKYDAATGANVPTSALCTKCLQTSTAIYKIGKAPANSTVKPLTVDGVVSTVWEVVPGAAASAPAAGSTGTVVESAQTFDAGIAMYVGMSVMAAAGSAVVIGKKKD